MASGGYLHVLVCSCAFDTGLLALLTWMVCCGRTVVEAPQPIASKATTRPNLVGVWLDGSD